MSEHLPKISSILAINRCIEKMSQFEVGDQTWCYADKEHPIVDGEWEFSVLNKGFYKRVKVDRGEQPFTWLGYPYVSSDDFYNFVLADMDGKARDQFIISTVNIHHRKLTNAVEC
jgi:hypothetical protein